MSALPPKADILGPIKVYLDELGSRPRERVSYINHGGAKLKTEGSRFDSAIKRYGIQWDVPLRVDSLSS
jgi:hypothetical protein